MARHPPPDRCSSEKKRRVSFLRCHCTCGYLARGLETEYLFISRQARDKHCREKLKQKTRVCRAGRKPTPTSSWRTTRQMEAALITTTARVGTRFITTSASLVGTRATLTVRKQYFLPLHYTCRLHNDHCAKTGSGQTYTGESAHYCELHNNRPQTAETSAIRVS